jgi:hypothetical protein
MRDDFAAVFEQDIGEETFVTFDQGAADQGCGELHDSVISASIVTDKQPSSKNHHIMMIF